MLYTAVKPLGAAKAKVRLPVESCSTITVTARTVPEAISVVLGSVSVVLPVSFNLIVFTVLATVIEPVAEVFSVNASSKSSNTKPFRLPLVSVTTFRSAALEQKTVFCPAPKLTALPEFELSKIVARVSVVPDAVYTPMPTSKSTSSVMQ